MECSGCFVHVSPWHDSWRCTEHRSGLSPLVPCGHHLGGMAGTGVGYSLRPLTAPGSASIHAMKVEGECKPWCSPAAPHRESSSRSLLFGRTQRLALLHSKGSLNHGFLFCAPRQTSLLMCYHSSLQYTVSGVGVLFITMSLSHTLCVSVCFVVTKLFS